MNSNLIINDMTSLMTALNFLDRKTQPDLKMEAYESYQWIGPDLFAPFNTDQLNPCSVDVRVNPTPAEAADRRQDHPKL